METWFSNVLTLPMNGQVVVARISRALSGRERGAGGPVGQGFSASFKDLSFVDLVQALGTGGKSVRMRIEHGSGMQADICFRQGRIVFAEGGEEKGVDVVYRVICWQDEGTSGSSRSVRSPRRTCRSRPTTSSLKDPAASTRRKARH